MAKKNNNIHEITIKIEGEEWQKALDESFKKKVKNVTIDGFRKGKCPRISCVCKNNLRAGYSNPALFSRCINFGRS